MGKGLRGRVQVRRLRLVVHLSEVVAVNVDRLRVRSSEALAVASVVRLTVAACAVVGVDLTAAFEPVVGIP